MIVSETRDRFGGERGFWPCPRCGLAAGVFRDAIVVHGRGPMVMAARGINGARCDPCELEQVDMASAAKCERVRGLVAAARPLGA